MALLDAAARWKGAALAGVASFDHGTGPHATAAVDLVERFSRRLGVPFFRGRGAGLGASEDAWRTARWRFLRQVATDQAAAVATAHTCDDQIETVFIRVLRDAGARGLAGLYATSDVVRPFIDVRREVVAAYADAMGVPFVPDPSNLSRRYLRNRIRLDLLPACERAQPGFGEAMLALSRKAASWRSGVERLADGLVVSRAPSVVFVDRAALGALEEPARALVWPALAARAGIALDRRGTERLARIGASSAAGVRADLAGGHQVIGHSNTFEIRAAASRSPVRAP